VLELWPKSGGYTYVVFNFKKRRKIEMFYDLRPGDLALSYIL
jgi:hypothetical protein